MYGEVKHEDFCAGTAQTGFGLFRHPGGHVRILDITNHIPVPTHGGASMYTVNLLRRIAADHEVWHVAYTTTLEQMAGADQMRSFCREVIPVPTSLSKPMDQPFDLFRFLAAGMPPELRLLYSREFANHIKRLVQTVEFDIVQIEHGGMGPYLDLIPREMWPRAIWMLHDIDWLKYSRIAQLETKRSRRLRLQVHSTMMRRWQPRHAMRFGCCTTISEKDRRLMVEANPQLHVDTVPAGVDTEKLPLLPPPDGKSTCVFVGNMNYLPNCDAVLYLCQQILPIIRQSIPDIEVWIVGTDPRPEVKALAGTGIYVTGAVEDVQPYYERSTVCVLPLRAGSGARLKVLEAMALGRPIVSTSIGCEGQELINGMHIMIADTPGEFARQTIELLCNEALRRHIIRHARELVVKNYSWDVSARRLTETYTRVVAG